MTINLLEQNTYKEDKLLIPSGSICSCKIEVIKDDNGNAIFTSQSSDAQYIKLRLEVLDRAMKGINSFVYDMIGIKGNSETVKAKGKDSFAYFGAEKLRDILCYNWKIPRDIKQRSEQENDRLSNIESFNVIDGMVCKVLVDIVKSEGYSAKNAIKRVLSDDNIGVTYPQRPVSETSADGIPF